MSELDLKFGDLVVSDAPTYMGTDCWEYFSRIKFPAKVIHVFDRHESAKTAHLEFANGNEDDLDLACLRLATPEDLRALAGGKGEGA